MKTKDKKNKKHQGRAKKVLAVFLAVIVILTVLGATGVVPQLSIVPDMVRVGIDYISLSTNKNASSAEDINIELNRTENLHPFILAQKEDFERIKEFTLSGFPDDYSKTLYEYVIENADALLDTKNFPLQEYALDEEDSILPISRECINRVIILSFAYNVTNEESYAKRAADELMNICNYPDWCPSHFLATAEMALAAAIGYDWLYDYLTQEQKDLLRDKAWEYAITPAMSKNYLKNWFTWSKNNWNSICYSGIGIASMAFYETDSYKAAEFLHMCCKNMPIAFESFTPHGVYAEGPGYCQSGMNAIVFFIATLNNLFGTDFGLSDIDGVKQLGYFPVHITGSAGMFNFGDNKDRMCYSPALHWYADEFNSPLLSVYQKNNLPSRYVPDLSENTERNGSGKENALSLLWYNPDIIQEGDNFSDEPLAVSLNSDAGQDIVVMRSGYCDENATYAAVKGGYNYINHGDLDIGTFVFDSQGVRWAEELGPGAYDAPGYFMGLPFGGRWNNYCKRAEGQNTLLINPDATKEDQYALAHAEIISFEETSQGATTVIDMTDAYKMNGAKKVTRTFSLTDNSSALEIKDVIECKKKSEIYWFMHTKADIEISRDGKKAVLTKDGKSLTATLSGDGSFSVMEAQKLQGKFEYDDDYADIKKLTVHLTDVKSTEITVKLAS